MKKQELFNKTVSILVNAFQNETLTHGDFCSCAVGNLIAANMGIKIIESGMSFSWDSFDYHASDWHSNVSCGCEYPDGNFQISSTGYKKCEIIDIERAFEIGETIRTDADGYLGLMSVIDTLMQIHECSIEEANEAKGMFVKV